MAGAASEVYEPLNQYKRVARNIGIVDGPFEYLTTAGVRLPLPFTTRMTVVRLGNGDLFIHSPIASSLRLLTACRRWAQSATSYRRTSSITGTLASGRVRFRERLPGPLRAHASVPARGASMCISIETSASNRRRNGA